MSAHITTRGHRGPAHRHRLRIYASGWHLAVTLAFIVVPFLFLLWFSEFANISRAKLFYDVFISCIRLFIAYGIAAVLGWILAVSFWRGRRGNVALPIFDVLQSFPTSAILPFAIFVWGATSSVVIFFLVITIIWPIFFSTISSLKLAKREWEEAVELSGITGFAYLRHYILPVSTPGFITGSIIGLGEAWEALIAAEIIVGVQGGLGGFFQSFSQNPTMTALGILGFLILIFSINKLVWFPLLEWSHRRMEE
jgi:ABC-type nitrate/sulfonate/bicarbonate transport system permease component